MKLYKVESEDGYVVVNAIFRTKKEAQEHIKYAKKHYDKEFRKKKFLIKPYIPTKKERQKFLDDDEPYEKLCYNKKPKIHKARKIFK